MPRVVASARVHLAGPWMPDRVDEVVTLRLIEGIIVPAHAAELRPAIATLHRSGWSGLAIAEYLGVCSRTVYRHLRALRTETVGPAC